MRVVQIITRLIVGGAQRIAIETAAALRARGDDAEIWCGEETGPEGSLAGEAARRGVPVVTIAELVKDVRPSRDLAAMRRITRELRAKAPDLVHTHSSKAGIIGRRAARAAGVPRVVHTIHGWGFSERTPLPARAAFVAAERAAAPWADRLVAVSEAVRDEGLRRGIGTKDLYRVIRPGIDTAPFADLEGLRRAGERLRASLGIPAGAVVAGTVGRLSPQKNPAMILDAAVAFPEVHWLLVGDGPLRSGIEERMRRRGIGDRVHLAGLRTDTTSAYGALDIFVLTSLWEGLPLTILEAMAAGLPVVAARAGGSAEVLPDSPAGWSFPTGDPEAFRSAFAQCLAAADTARRAAAAHRPRAIREHGLDGMLDSILRLYAELPGKF